MSGIYHEWNGTVLTVTSDSGTSSADLKGDDGCRGAQGAQGEQYKPIKGVDYFTEEDLNEIAVVANEAATELCKDMVTKSEADLTYMPITAQFAPSGYGLGQSAVMISSGDNLNNYKVGGWYQFTAGVANIPFNYGMMLVIHGNDYNKQCFQYAFSRYPANNMAIRQLFDGVWGEWEWQNPPMTVGTEYRTTERFKGKPVYKKLCAYTTTETINANNSGTYVLNVAFNVSMSELVSADIKFVDSSDTDKRARVIPAYSGNGNGFVVLNAILLNGYTIFVCKDYKINTGSTITALFTYTKE